jgi:murein L,D-transpeptidase YcbB/YkuD
MLLLAALLASAPAGAVIEQIEVAPSRQPGLDMILIDEDALPQEPELARHLPEGQDESWSGSAIDLLMPVHPLYTDLRRQLARYRATWGSLPQVRVAAEGPTMGAGSADPRVSALRQRLGLPRAGTFDAALQAKLTDYQKAHGLAADGKAGPGTIASLNQGAAHFERLILLNMERARRLPASDAKGKYVLVDAGSARLFMYENGRQVDSMKVVVGAPATETPMMAALMRYSSVNPYWNVPPELVKKLIAVRVLEQGMTYLSERGYQVLDGWYENSEPMDPNKVDWKAVAAGDLEIRVRQLPGGANSMGKIKFMLPNEYGIYLHDTPNKAPFEEANRWISNGCVRVEDAPRLARWLYGAMPQGTAADREDRVDLAQPVPVYMTYFTVGADAKGLSFWADPYSRDAAVLARFGSQDDRMVDPDEQFRTAMTIDG